MSTGLQLHVECNGKYHSSCLHKREVPFPPRSSDQLLRERRIDVVFTPDSTGWSSSCFIYPIPHLNVLNTYINPYVHNPHLVVGGIFGLLFMFVCYMWLWFLCPRKLKPTKTALAHSPRTGTEVRGGQISRPRDVSRRDLQVMSALTDVITFGIWLFY